MRILISMAMATVIALSGHNVSADDAHVRAMVSKLSLPPSPGLPNRVLSVQEVKNNPFLRRHFPSIDINQIRFRFNSALLAPYEHRRFEDIAAAIQQLLNHNQNEIFLVEGHTDAPGPRRYNLALSAQRAISVRNVLIAQYGIPAASLMAVGYGEEFLKIPIRYREARNRRVTVRRITYALGFPVISETASPQENKDKAKPGFKPTLKQSQALPFTPPEAELPAMIKQPEQLKAEPAAPKAEPDFKPTLKQSQALPFTPPEAELPAVIKQPEQPKAEPAAPKAEPEFKPILKQSQTLPFTPPEAELPTMIKQPQQPKAEPAVPKVKSDFTSTQAPRQMLPFYPMVLYRPVQPRDVTVPGLSLYSQIPYGQALAWNMRLPSLSSGIYVEHWELPTRYRFRLHPGNQRLQDIQFSVEGGVLVIRSQARPWYRQRGGEGGYQAMWQFGDFIQWMSLPADADVNAIRWSVNDGVMEIFIPKRR